MCSQWNRILSTPPFPSIFLILSLTLPLPTLCILTASVRCPHVVLSTATPWESDQWLLLQSKNDSPPATVNWQRLLHKGRGLEPIHPHLCMLGLCLAWPSVGTTAAVSSRLWSPGYVQKSALCPYANLLKWNSSRLFKRYLIRSKTENLGWGRSVQWHSVDLEHTGNRIQSRQIQKVKFEWN